VREGYCFFSYSKDKFDSLSAYSTPEIQRVSLEGVCLQLKMIQSNSQSKRNSAALNLKDLLSKTVQPPSLDLIEVSVSVLQQLGCLSNDEDLTPLGKLLAILPVTNIRIGKMLVYGAIFQCLTPVIVIAALISERSPFLSPRDRKTEATEAKMKFKVFNSDHLTLARAFESWFKVHKKGNFQEDLSFCEQVIFSIEASKLYRTFSPGKH